MSLPTVENTWIFTKINQSYSESSNSDLCIILMYNIKVSLVSLGWSVVGSSNSSSAGESDYWSSISDLIWSATNHSWLVLKNDNLNIELCIDLYSSIKYYADIYVSRVGFSGFTSTSERPSASDEVRINNGSYWGPNNTVTNAALHILTTNEGANGPKYNFVFVVFQSTGTKSNCWIFNEIYSSEGILSNPVFVFCSRTVSQESPSLSHLYETASYNIICNSNNFYNKVYLTGEGVSNTLTINSILNGAPSDFDSSYPFSTIGVYCESLGFSGKIGKIKDMWWSYTGHTTGDVYPSTSNDFAKFGVIAVPWGDNSAPLIGS